MKYIFIMRTWMRYTHDSRHEICYRFIMPSRKRVLQVRTTNRFVSLLVVVGVFFLCKPQKKRQRTWSVRHSDCVSHAKIWTMSCGFIFETNQRFGVFSLKREKDKKKHCIRKQRKTWINNRWESEEATKWFRADCFWADGWNLSTFSYRILLLKYH